MRGQKTIWDFDEYIPDGAIRPRKNDLIKEINEGEEEQKESEQNESISERTNNE